MSFYRRTYRYLDTLEDRQQLAQDVAQVRAAVLAVVDQIPEYEHYLPRYHGWSPAAMLGHLNTVDNLARWQIQAALLGIHPRVSMGLINRMNGLMAKVYRTRLVTTSTRNIQRNERRIIDLIMRLPMQQYSKSVYYAPFEMYTTVERVLQDYFVYHWQEHLQTMHIVEGIPLPPEPRSDSG